MMIPSEMTKTMDVNTQRDSPAGMRNIHGESFSLFAGTVPTFYLFIIIVIYVIIIALARVVWGNIKR